MTDDTTQASLDWVTARVQQLSRERGVTLTPLGWHRSVADLTARRHRLLVQLTGGQTDIAFEDTTLVDVPSNVLQQVIVDARLRLLLDEQRRDTLSFTA